MNKKLLAAGICVCLAAGTLTGCGSDTEKAVATVGGTDIEYGLLNFMLRYNQAQMQTWYGAYLGEDYWTTYGEQSKTGILEDLETMVVLEQHMDEYGVSLTDDEKSSITEAAAAFIEANEEDTLKAMNGTQDVVERTLTLYTEQRKMYYAIIAKADTNVTDEEAAQKTVQFCFFSTADTTDEDGNAVERTDEEKAEIKAQAQQVLDSVKDGMDMDEALALVDESKSTTTSSYGADNGSLNESIKEVAEQMTEDGQVADELVEIDTGYYVVKMVTLFDEEATEERKDDIVADRKSDLYSETTEAWLEEAEVTTNDKLLEKLSFLDTWQLKETETESETGTEALTEEATETAATEETTSAEAETDTETEADTTEAETTEAAAAEADTTDAATTETESIEADTAETESETE